MLVNGTYVDDSTVMLLIKALFAIVGGAVVLISLRTKCKIGVRIPFILLGIAIAVFGLIYF